MHASLTRARARSLSFTHTHTHTHTHATQGPADLALVDIGGHSVYRTMLMPITWTLRAVLRTCLWLSDLTTHALDVLERCGSGGRLEQGRASRQGQGQRDPKRGRAPVPLAWSSGPGAIGHGPLGHVKATDSASTTVRVSEDAVGGGDSMAGRRKSAAE